MQLSISAQMCLIVGSPAFGEPSTGPVAILARRRRFLGITSASRDDVVYRHKRSDIFCRIGRRGRMFIDPLSVQSLLRGPEA